jgi:hypothetical protein
MTGGKPVRLTFPSLDVGSKRIMAGRRCQAGLLLGEFYGVRAYLWPAADERPGNPHEVEQAWFPLFREARRVLRERVADSKRGPWWTA